MPSARSIRRRNAIIPLPLLPPVPSNTIVTSVRIVHNQCASDPGIIDSTPPDPPPSPTPTNLCFAPLTGGSTKRPRSGRRRSTCTPCQAPPDNNCDSSLLNPNRKPRSTIVVTVRLANPPPSNASYGSRAPNIAPALRRPPPVPPAGPRGIGVGNAFAAMQARKMAYRPRVSSPLASSAVTVGDDPGRIAMDPDDISPLSSPAASCTRLYSGHRCTKRDDLDRMAMDPGDIPPLSSPDASCTRLYSGQRYTKRDDLDRMAMDPGGISPISSPVASCTQLSITRRNAKKNGSSKKSGKGKNGGRIGMLRWAVLNNSGPEVGRRIVCMGPKLAKEIWEAERIVEEIEAVESNEMEVMEHKREENIEASADCEEQRVREQLAEECIRELEEMDVDSEDIVMEQSSTLEAATTEKATETHQTENNNNRMDLDMPAPVAVVTPLSTARQVQIQVEFAVEVFSPAKKAQKDAERSRRWFERIAL